MKVLSIDQATVKTGIAVHDNGKLTVYDLIDLEKGDIEKSERVCVMIKRICEFIHKCSPNHVVIEDVALQSNAATLILLSRLQGAIVGYCLVNNIPYSILKPPNWRKTLGFTQGQGIKRNELKKQAVEYVKSKYGLKLSIDVCEAVCIGRAYLEIIGFRK